MRHTLNVTRSNEPTNVVPSLLTNETVSPYSNLHPRLAKVAARLYYTNPTTPGPLYPTMYSSDELGQRVYGLTDFTFVTRPTKLGSAIATHVYED